MTADRPVAGILLMVGFCVLAPMADSIAKLLGAELPILTLLVARIGLQVALLLPLALASGAALIWRRRVLALVALRSVLHLAGLGAIFLSLVYLPLADAIAIAYVMPFILLLLGWLLLGEEVGWRRIAACAVGFAGTLLVLQPRYAEIGAPALLPLAVAVIFACFMLVTRRIARATDPVALQVTGGAISLLLLLPLVLAAGGLPALPDASQLLLLAAMGVVGTLAHLAMTWSLRLAPASTLAPMQYLEIPVATCYGWIIFHDFPNRPALAGIALTIAAGLYIGLREHALSRAARAPQAPPAGPPVAG